MVLSERNQKVQVSPPECVQEPLTEGIGLGTPYRGFEDSQPQVAYTLVEILGEDCITVMHQEPIAMRGRNGIAQLLQRPVCGGMVGYVRMENSACCVFHHDNHIEKPKGDRDHHAKVAGDDGRGMVADKRPPALGGDALPSTGVHALRHVLPHGPRRHSQAQLELEFVGNSFFTP